VKKQVLEIGVSTSFITYEIRASKGLRIAFQDQDNSVH
jgi:hypothetical protein